jgi:hypothetical protein
LGSFDKQRYKGDFQTAPPCKKKERGERRGRSEIYLQEEVGRIVDEQRVLSTAKDV